MIINKHGNAAHLSHEFSWSGAQFIRMRRWTACDKDYNLLQKSATLLTSIAQGLFRSPTLVVVLAPASIQLSKDCSPIVCVRSHSTA